MDEGHDITMHLAGGLVSNFQGKLPESVSENTSHSIQSRGIHRKFGEQIGRKLGYIIIGFQIRHVGEVRVNCRTIIPFLTSLRSG